MLNVADFGMLFAPVAGAVGAGSVTQEHGGGWLVVLLIVLGLFGGAAIGVFGNKLAYGVLARSSAPAGERETLRHYMFDLLYMLSPLFTMAVSAGAMFFLALGILSLAK